MPDWTKSMVQSFEFYKVDPISWSDMYKLDEIISCTIERNYDSDTLGSASLETSKMLGELYVRVYLVTIQNGVTERTHLGTFLLQTPKVSFDGRISNINADAYTPLIELKENTTDLGYSILKNENIMNTATQLVKEHCRAPVLDTYCNDTLPNNFVAEKDENWFSYISTLISSAKYRFAFADMMQIAFEKSDVDYHGVQPVWTFGDDNNSILYADVTLTNDMYAIPNVIEVIYSDESGAYFVGRAENNDEDSPLSKKNRGREIVKRVLNPSFNGTPSQEMVDQLAYELLERESTLQYTIQYSHGYCPVKLGDCVIINYKRANLTGIKAKVISQSIKCTPGCQVTETAVFTKKLWSGGE